MLGHSSRFCSTRGAASAAFSAMRAWTLYQPHGGPPEVTKVVLTAQMCGIPLQVKNVASIKEIPAVENASSVAVSARFPVLHMPRASLFGSQAICRFLANSTARLGLQGDSFQDQGEVDSWLEWMQNEFEIPLGVLHSEMQRTDAEEAIMEEARRNVASAVKVLDGHLHSNTYFVGHHVTLADICAQGALRHVQVAAPSLLPRSRFLSLFRWFDTVEGQLASIPVADANRSLSPKFVPTKAPKEGKAKGEAKAKSKAKAADSGAGGGGNQDGITATKADDFPLWYTQVITKSEMIEYYDISGCYILRPWSFFIWEQIQQWFDGKIKELGVQNSYFPLFVSEDALNAEKDHIEGFAPEVAWVTKSGSSDLAKPIAIRPTSETIMYPAFAKWIRSHRDLPMRLNQWTSVVRWEFKQPTPFIRTREFLWQEGHTAHATHEEAKKMVTDILSLYARVYEEILAVPVVQGVKSEGEKFAGGYMTTTVEAFVPSNGRGIQAATSHHLGTNFAKMFNITYEDENGQKRPVEQTSWGLTTRSIGVMVMVHADDDGLVLPPRIAPKQVVMIPIPAAKGGLDIKEMRRKCDELAAQLKAAGIRVEVDDRDNYTPGWKYNHWEVKGVPIRIEIGAKDMEKGTFRFVRRDTKAKVDSAMGGIVQTISAELEKMQADMLRKAKEERDNGIVKVTEWSDVMPTLEQRKLVLAPWCETIESEEAIKKATKEASVTAAAEAAEAAAEAEGSAPALSGAMKSLCIPIEQPPMPAGTKCFFTGAPAKRWCLFGRSY